MLDKADKIAETQATPCDASYQWRIDPWHVHVEVVRKLLMAILPSKHQNTAIWAFKKLWLIHLFDVWNTMTPKSTGNVMKHGCKMTHPWSGQRLHLDAKGAELLQQVHDTLQRHGQPLQQLSEMTRFTKMRNPYCLQKTYQRMRDFVYFFIIPSFFQLMVHWWFGSVVWIPGIPLWKGLSLRGTPIGIPNHRDPNQQLTISWPFWDLFFTRSHWLLFESDSIHSVTQSLDPGFGVGVDSRAACQTRALGILFAAATWLVLVTC